jgi:hypothetical protein
LWLEHVKGTRQYQQDVVVQTERRNTLRVIHRSGYDITIYCQRVQYETMYSLWPFAKIHLAYQLFSRTTHDAPELIQRACELQVTLPAQCPVYVADEVQKLYAIDAYVDLITDKLRSLKQSSFI